MKVIGNDPFVSEKLHAEVAFVTTDLWVFAKRQDTNLPANANDEYVEKF